VLRSLKAVSVCFLCLVSLIAFFSSSKAVVSPSSSTDNLFAQQEIDCLALNIYHEARNQSVAGQYAVALVTLNRTLDYRYADTVCGVIRQGKHVPSWKDPTVMVPVRHQCQFSWYCDGKSDEIMNVPLYRQIHALAKKIYYGYHNSIDITNGATHYHSVAVNPHWRGEVIKTTKIDDHIFYRWEKR
jgi:N-acetylmuramoyl-L-alanine amidase